jgi:hypothetical protein
MNMTCSLPICTNEYQTDEQSRNSDMLALDFFGLLWYWYEVSTIVGDD